MPQGYLRVCGCPGAGSGATLVQVERPAALRELCADKCAKEGSCDGDRAEERYEHTDGERQGKALDDRGASKGGAEPEEYRTSHERRDVRVADGRPRMVEPGLHRRG